MSATSARKLSVIVSLILIVAGCNRNVPSKWHWKESPVLTIDGESRHQFPDFELPCDSNQHLIGWVWQKQWQTDNSWYALVFTQRHFSSSAEAKRWVEDEMTKYCHLRAGEG